MISSVEGARFRGTGGVVRGSNWEDPSECGTVLAPVRLIALATKGDYRRASMGLTLPPDPATLALLKTTTNKPEKHNSLTAERVKIAPRKTTQKKRPKTQAHSTHMRSRCKTRLSFARRRGLDETPREKREFSRERYSKTPALT